MDFKQLILTLVVFIIPTMIIAQVDVKPNEGIAFIHGTRDHSDDAYGGYWKTDYIESISQGLENPANYYVVHCNFNHYMWHTQAAGCVARQLLEFSETHHISSLTVYTHSDGANVIRWILSNPTYSKRYMKLKSLIRQVIAIAPSSGGTLLADEVFSGGAFETSVAWLIGYKNDAIKQQRVGDMLIYNEELLLGGKNRPSLSLPFKNIVGTDVKASPFSSASYCNGILLNSGLKITKLYLDHCSDGFLDCKSQTAAGELWFYDIDKTEGNRPLSHNQSRHSCFGLDSILKSVLSMKGAD